MNQAKDDTEGCQSSLENNNVTNYTQTHTHTYKYIYLLYIPAYTYTWKKIRSCYFFSKNTAESVGQFPELLQQATCKLLFKQFLIPAPVLTSHQL